MSTILISLRQSTMNGYLSIHNIFCVGPDLSLESAHLILSNVSGVSRPLIIANDGHYFPLFTLSSHWPLLCSNNVIRGW